MSAPKFKSAGPAIYRAFHSEAREWVQRVLCARHTVLSTEFLQFQRMARDDEGLECEECAKDTATTRVNL